MPKRSIGVSRNGSQATKRRLVFVKEKTHCDPVDGIDFRIVDPCPDFTNERLHTGDVDRGQFIDEQRDARRSVRSLGPAYRSWWRVLLEQTLDFPEARLESMVHEPRSILPPPFEKRSDHPCSGAC